MDITLVTTCVALQYYSITHKHVFCNPERYWCINIYTAAQCNLLHLNFYKNKFNFAAVLQCSSYRNGNLGTASYRNAATVDYKHSLRQCITFFWLFIMFIFIETQISLKKKSNHPPEILWGQSWYSAKSCGIIPVFFGWSFRCFDRSCTINKLSQW